MNGMANLFETIMVICFGLSWPMSILKAVRTKTAKGKSLFFLFMIFVGYICGILSKVFSHNITYVFIFYVLNLIMIVIELFLYFRYSRYDRMKEQAADVLS